jgi:hypothetical protein
MDARITHGPRETFESETYRDYVIDYDHTGGVFYVSNSAGYRRGISSLRKDARRWVDLLITGKVR